MTSSRVQATGSFGIPHLSRQDLGKLYLTQRDKCVQGGQYKLFGIMGLIFEQVGSKLGHRLETTGEDVAGETVAPEKAEVEIAEEGVPKAAVEKVEVIEGVAVVVTTVVMVAVGSSRGSGGGGNSG